MSYTTGLVGLSGIGTRHRAGYAAAEDIDLVAIADIDDEKLHRFGEAWDIPPELRYSNHESMLSAQDLDIISVCTPTHLHPTHVLDAVQSGADPDVIWCEKPIASQLSAAEEMIDACAETDTELVVNHSFRFTTKLQRLRELVHEEHLVGDIRSVSAQFRMELLRNSTHLLDTLLYLVDAKPDIVSGYITGENEAVESLDVDIEIDDAGGGGFVVLDDGTFTTIDCTPARAISSMNYSIIGTEGKLYLNNDDGEWRYWALDGDEHTELDLRGIEGSWTWEEDYRDAFANAAQHLVDLLEGRSSNQSTGREAKQSLEIIVGFYLSHYTGGTVTLPFDRPLRDVTITSW